MAGLDWADPGAGNPREAADAAWDALRRAKLAAEAAAEPNRAGDRTRPEH